MSLNGGGGANRCSKNPAGTGQTTCDEHENVQHFSLQHALTEDFLVASVAMKIAL